jgi:cephalosporin-C deacetylase-like acetyl esterase
MTVTRRASSPLALTIAVLLAAGAQAQTVSLTPDHSNGFYRAGETVRWQVAAAGAVSNEVDYVIKSGGLVEVAKGRTPLVAGKGEIVSRLAEPGSLLVEAAATGATGETLRILSGAVFSADKIQPSSPRPPDFDSFWQTKLNELAQVPTNAVLIPVSCSRTNVDYWQISMGNIRGSHIHGQLARPKQGERLPAILVVQWAGIYALQPHWVTDHAAAGWLALNIEAHDLPIDQPDAFYKEQSTRFAFKDYMSIGVDRETSYFLRLYLSCYRAADYLAHRSDWDGKTLVVTGGSQGGLQTFVTAGLHPRITAALAEVPAGCDLLCANAGRAPSWPMWFYGTNRIATNAVLEAARYYDTVNFASRITCPFLVGVGLVDKICPPAGVFAACNQLAGPKEIVLLPKGGHGESGQDHSHAPYRARFDAWLSALRQGRPPPVRAPGADK